MTSSQPQPPPGPQPVVLLVNQQTIMDPRLQAFSSSVPYLNRGAHFNNGCKCYLPHMIMLISLGILFLFVGFGSVATVTSASIVILAVAGSLLGFGVYLMQAAKKQFNSLPPDHPDRIKYAIQNVSSDPHPYHTPVVYSVPPMQNQMMGYPSTTAGQVYLMPNSVGMHGGQAQFITQPGSRSPYGTYRPEDDPPPAYSDVVHNI